jgi:hypothetical protein
MARAGRVVVELFAVGEVSAGSTQENFTAVALNQEALLATRPELGMTSRTVPAAELSRPA